MIISKLFFGYDGSVLFANFDLYIDRKLTVIEGYSGCGKTSLLKIIAGTLAPSSSREMTVVGRPLLVVQEDSLLPWLSGVANLACFGQGGAISIGAASLRRLINPFIGQTVHKMSYGQRRLVEIYRALDSKASVLLFDEPFNFLDRASARSVWECLVDEAKSGRTVIISTHHHQDFVAGTEAEVLSFEGVPPWRRLEHGRAARA